MEWLGDIFVGLVLSTLLVTLVAFGVYFIAIPIVGIDVPLTLWQIFVILFAVRELGALLFSEIS